MRAAQEFLVNIELNTGDLNLDAVLELKAAEAIRADELRRAGKLTTIWRIPDRWANVGLWCADDRRELDSLLDSLPLRPYMSITVTALEPHPSDPKKTRYSSQTERRGYELAALPAVMVRSRRTTGSARRKWSPLDELPPLEVRRRSGLQLDASTSGHAVSELAHSQTDEFDQLWADLDVTRLVPGAERNSKIVANAVFEAVTEAAAAAFAASTPPRILQSNQDAIDGRACRSTAACIGVGTLRRLPAIHEMEDGTEGIQVRSFVQVSVVTDLGQSASQAIEFMNRLRTMVSAQQGESPRTRQQEREPRSR